MKIGIIRWIISLSFVVIFIFNSLKCNFGGFPVWNASEHENDSSSFDFTITFTGDVMLA